MNLRGPLGHVGVTTVRNVGSTLPPDLLARVVEGGDLPGLTPTDYHLEFGVTPREAANRAWSILTGAWAGYRAALAERSDGDAAVGLTREKWLTIVLRELGFGRVATTHAGGVQADGRSFPVSHLWDDVPIHLLGWGVDLDRRSPGVAGAAEKAPHAMMQELLNRSDEHLYAILSNGRKLRLLRDSTALVGQSFVEFDLEAMFEGEVFSDFVVLYLLAHQSRFEPVESGAGPEDCWLERWRNDAVETGARALGGLRVGVRDALQSLGTGFLQHPANTDLRAAVNAGTLTLSDYHRSLLRLVYRLLFCFVAEDRDLLLLPPSAGPNSTGPYVVARNRYRDWFSTSRLRRIAMRRQGTGHGDLWRAISLVLAGLGRDGGRPELALPALGGLFEDGPSDVVSNLELANRHLLAAVRHLCVVQPADGGPKRRVDYRNLGAEELGGIYESLLELVPRRDAATETFTFEVLSGNDRKTSGSYYTPSSLTDCLLDTALDPLLDAAERDSDPEGALLAITVCDPACGSGHFLVAAARRIAARLATVRAKGAEPTVTDSQQAMHDVVGRCIYGVDLNPMAAELARVSLSLEAVLPGRPLSLLTGHIKVGNALLGANPTLLADGIPDAAFAALVGDDKRTVTTLKKRNKAERVDNLGDLFSSGGTALTPETLGEQATEIDRLPTLSLADVHLAEQRRRTLDVSPELRRARLLADAWCAAFVAPKAPGEPAITQAVLRRWETASFDDIETEPEYDVVSRMADRYRFFHWHLEFPQILTIPDQPSSGERTGGAGGFTCVLGNPPWERVKLQEQEFFAAREPAIAAAPNAAARKKLIKELATTQPTLYAEFGEEKRKAEGESHLLRNSGRYPLCGRGDINTYAVFAEHDRNLLAPHGRLGVILPTGIATDATTQHYFRDLVTTGSLASLFDFENRNTLFDGVDSRMKFCLLTLSGRADPIAAAEFAFFARELADLSRPGMRFELTPEEITLLNPNTGTCPVFRSRRDAEITLGIYRRVPVLIRVGDPDGNPWGLSFMRMIDMSNDSHLFHTRDRLEADGWTLRGNTFHRGSEVMLPLYEAKMVHHFDHRWATYSADDKIRDTTEAEHADPTFSVLPRYWVAKPEVATRLTDRWDNQWLIGFRDICRSTDERTMISATVPPVAIGNNLPVALGEADWSSLFSASVTSLVYDFAARLKVGGTHMNFFIAEQLPVLPPQTFDAPAAWDHSLSVGRWLQPRILELTYTAWDMEPFARDLGDDGPPFQWDPERRAELRAELDGAFFHLYGIERDDVDYILGTFPIVNRKDVDRFGEERTRRLVLEAYDALAKAIDTGTPFVSTLVPVPGAGPRHEPRPVP